MSQLITISNDILKVSISSNKAELMSIEKNGKEFIWQANSTVWTQRCPILFPICGGLKEDKYTYGGKEYTLPKHGFAKLSEFEVESVTDKKAVFLLRSNEETLKSYPFEYELRIIYTLDGASVKVEYKVDNKTDGPMYFSIGSHEAYYTPTGVENYDVIFSEKETLRATLGHGALLSHDKRVILKNSNTLPLIERILTIEGLVFTDIKSRSVTLRNRITGRGVKVDYPYADNFLLWHSMGAPFICLEPWAGIPDYIDSDYDITKKPGIIPLEKGETYLGEHTITFIDED